ncbi:MAG: sugar ABC transporter ATP-binding protein [Pararobbsia sp.]
MNREEHTQSEPSPILRMTRIDKRFPGVHALRQVDFRLLPGEIHTLMGQNGAGKSTLINVLTGVLGPDSGDIELDGRPVRFASPKEAESYGVRTLYQEVNLCPNLSVAENIYAGRQPIRNGRIDWAAMREGAIAALARLNLSLDVDKALDYYPIAIQQMAAIARALSVDARVLILDEPTSSLDEDEVARLFAVLRQLKQSRIAILFVTHFLEQTYAISDRITVMRNGERVGEYLARDLPPAQLVAKMVGHEGIGERLEATAAQLAERLERKEAAAGQARPAFVAMRGVGRRGQMQPVDIEVRRGEILGLAGLLGSGRTETARLLFGVDRADTGEVAFDGTPVRLRSPHDAVGQGIGYCPEDRKREGLVAELSIRENIVLALQAKLGWRRFIRRKAQRALADDYIARLGIKAADAEQPVGLLSGGNQQKVLLARWLATEPQLLILDEPTRGIDVAAKFEIMDQMLALCAKGLGILFISSEVSEVTRMSHRVAVLRDRSKIAELSGRDATDENIYRLISGASQ